MSSLPPRKGRRRLVRELLAAYESLSRWDLSLRQSLQSVGAVQGPSDRKVLLDLLETAKKGLNLRLVELGVEEFTADSSSSFAQSEKTARGSPSRLCLRACQACGRTLGAAFREAQAVADGTSAQMIYRSLRAFEKHIWVLDPRQELL